MVDGSAVLEIVMGRVGGFASAGVVNVGPSPGI